MPAGRYYVDTSAYLCVLLGEAGWERLVKELAGGRLLSSSLLALEAERTLVHLSRAGRLSPEHLQEALDRLAADLAQFTLRDLTLDLCRSQAMPIVSTPRSLDPAPSQDRAVVPRVGAAGAIREPRLGSDPGRPRAAAPCLAPVPTAPPPQAVPPPSSPSPAPD